MTFDPYTAWLGLPAGPRPPDPYTLLGLARFERDPARIAAAVEKRMREIGRVATPDQGDEKWRLLREVREASDILSGRKRRQHGDPQPPTPEKQKHRPAAVDPRIVETADFTAMPAVAKFRERPHSAVANARVPSRQLRTAGTVAGLALLLVCLAGAVWLTLRTAGEPAALDSTKADRAVAKVPAVRPAVVRLEPQAPEVTATPVAEPEPPTADEIAPAAAATDVALTEPVAAPNPFDQPARTDAEPRAFVATLPAVDARKPYLPPISDYRPPRFNDPAARDAYVRHVSALLEAGFGRRADPSLLATSHREAAALAPGDPFTEYAAAIALWKRLNFAEAEPRLRAAYGSDGDPFLPARRASIRLLLNLNRRPQALTEAVGFATVLGALDDPRRREGRDASIRWLGRLVAGLEAPWNPATEPAKNLADADSAIRSALGPEAAPIYEAGRRSLVEDYATRSAEVEARIAEIASGHEAERSETLNEIAESRETTQDERDKVGRTAAEWQEWFDQETKGLDERLTTLSTSLQRLNVQVEAVTATVLSLSLEITNAQVGNTLPPGLPGGPRPGRSPDLARLIVARDEASVRLQFLEAQRAEVRREGQALMAKRQAIVSKFEAETKTLAAKSDSLRKWETALKRRESKAQAAEASDTPAAKTLRRGLRDFDSYLPFSPDSERDALLRAMAEGK